MAATPPKCIYEKAPKYFKNEMTEEEKKQFEENLKMFLRIAKEVFR